MSGPIEAMDPSQWAVVDKNFFFRLLFALELFVVERKLEARVKNQEELFDDEDGPNDEIIDEEELMLLREQKDLKREYRDKYSQLKSLKSEM